MGKIIKIAVLFVLLIGIIQPASSQSEEKEDMTAFYKQFDFWVGDWDVYKYGDETTIVGSNKIERILDGKAIRETYASGKSKYKGTSLNKFNPNSKVWEQFWVDNSGLTLHLQGGIVDGNMVLSSKEKTKDGTIENKITWVPNENGTVRQIWETRTDKETEWKTAFDGLYKKKKSDGN